MNTVGNKRPVLNGLWALKIRKIFFLAAVCAWFSICLTGCKNKDELKIDPQKGEYLIYYLNSAATKLVGQPYEAQSETKEELTEELMEQFLNVPKDVDSQTALSDKVIYQGSRLEQQVLYLYFDMNYTSMKPDREILCRAALARTLTQIEGIDYISIYCGEQPLMDAQGKPVGMLSAGDFILNMSNVNAYEKTELTLYFADMDGSHLVEEKREVVHNMNTSLEQLIVEQLILGPEQSDSQAVLPPDCKILSLSVTDNICYINFDSAFLNNSLPVNEFIPFYSIVESLSFMTAVTKVQIMVNGSQDVLFRDVVPLNMTFERNPEYVRN